MSKSGTILYLDGVSVTFDGFRAIRNLSLVLDRGEMRAVIGPNGAGKTTMMDIITGKTRPDEGEVFFDSQIDLTRHDEAEIATIGIGRKFQKPTVFESHTVEDNLALSLAGSQPCSTDAAPTRRAALTTSSMSSDSAKDAIAPRPSSVMARSSGWKSACFSPRIRSCCSWTNRLPA
jgi:urea transport system ATP-binding protein